MFSKDCYVFLESTHLGIFPKSLDHFLLEKAPFYPKRSNKFAAYSFLNEVKTDLHLLERAR